MPEITESEAAAYAQSHGSFYDLLNLENGAQVSDVRRAYRKASLLYHPDKNPDNPKAVETFHLITAALDILCDPALRKAYDNALEARAAKKRRNEAYDDNRRKMKADLEERENLAKRVKTDEDERKREFERLKEEGARFRMEMDERKRKKAAGEDKEKEEAEAAAVKAQRANELQDEKWENEQAASTAAAAGRKSRFTELDRTIRVRLKRKGKGETFDKTDLELLFRQFGPIEACVIKASSGAGDKEKKYRTALVVFEDITGAHAAVKHDRDQDPDPDWKIFRDITWASGKEPDLGVDKAAKGTERAPERKPQAGDENGSAGESIRKKDDFPRATTTAAAAAASRSIGRVPTFSFNATAKTSTTGKTPIIPGADISSNDYESITIMRMRERAAERKKLAEEIRRQEAEEDTSMKE